MRTMSSPAVTRRDSLDGLAAFLLVTCCLLWGLNQVAVKVALPQLPPLTQVALRSAGALLLLVLFARSRGISLWSARTVGPGLLAGVLFALEFACIYSGLQYTSASRMVVFLYTTPFMVALGMRWLNPQEQLLPAQWAGLLVAFGGVAVAFWEGFSAPAVGPLQWWGDTLGVAGAALWAATTVLIRGTALATAPAEQTLCYQLLVGTVLTGGAALAFEGAAGLPWGALQPLVLGSMLFQAAVVTFASYLVWFWLLARYPAARLATFTLLTPVAGLLFGVLLLHEPLTPVLALGLAGVTLGIVLVNRR
jgi:drug/metabolite transporter (DMT)-like permease